MSAAPVARGKIDRIKDRMVYFGEKSYRSAGTSVSSRGRRRVVILVVILIAVAAAYVGMNWGSDNVELPKEFNVTVVEEGAKQPVVTEGGKKVYTDGVSAEDIPDVPPLTDVNREPDPFIDNPLFLEAIEDDGDPNGTAEQLALMYLFHRWVTGVDVPVEEDFPNLRDVPQFSSAMRGRRYELYVRLQMSPFPRDLPDNGSGVQQYWEAWGQDGRALYRILFVDKDPELVLEEKKEWKVVADFLRVHKYERTDGGMARVPELIAMRFEEPREILQTDTSWFPLIVSGAIGGIGVLLLLGLWLKQEHSQKSRRGREKHFKMGPRD